MLKKIFHLFIAPRPATRWDLSHHPRPGFPPRRPVDVFDKENITEEEIEAEFDRLIAWGKKHRAEDAAEDAENARKSRTQ